jgi:glycosyltransferase involved in cell wall biosynthesis
VRLAERLTYAAADVVLATNGSVASIACGRGRKRRAEVFEVRTAPAIAASTVSADPALRKGRRYLVGYVGVMGSVDGVEYLLQAAAHIVHDRARRDVQFLVMGTGPEYERLLALRDGLNLREFVDLPGRVSDEFLFAALQTIDVGAACDPINPFNHHCTMNKVLEYMVFGKPQVMFDLREGRASAGGAALYVAQNSATAFGDAILTLLDDPDLRTRMGQEGAARIRNRLGWDRSVHQLLLAYRAALQKAAADGLRREAAASIEPGGDGQCDPRRRTP